MPKCMKSKKNGMNKRSFLQIVYYIYKIAPRILIVVLILEIILGLIQTVALITWEYTINTVADLLVGNVSYQWFIIVLLTNLGCYLLMDVIRMFVEAVHTLLNQKIIFHLQAQLNQKCRKIDVLYFEKSELYNDIERGRNAIEHLAGIVGIIGIFVMSIARLSTLGSYVFFETAMLTLLVILPIIPILITRFIRGRDLYQLNFIQSEKRRQAQYYKSCITKKETRTLNATLFFKEKWRDIYIKANKEEAEVNQKISCIFFVMNLLKYTIYTLAIITVTYYLYTGVIEVGMFALVGSMLGTTHATFEALISKAGDIVSCLKYSDDYFYVLDELEEVFEKKVVFENQIELQNVSFMYPNSNQYAIKRMNLKINKEECIALVGINGAGKSTLAKLIAGFYEPTEGKILYNETICSKKEQLDCTIVFQNFCKYYLSLRENVAFGNINKIEDDEGIKKALKMFLFDMKKVSDSIDTKLGREFGGMELSGGEWQKIALSRGNMKSSRFIILDEPNSNLDSLTESKLFEVFAEIMSHRTGIIITHRIGIAKLANRILLLENGQILEDGTHEELMKKHGKYYEMFQLQAQMYL